jgi:hypothetical protein
MVAWDFEKVGFRAGCGMIWAGSGGTKVKRSTAAYVKWEGMQVMEYKQRDYVQKRRTAKGQPAWEMLRLYVGTVTAAIFLINDLRLICAAYEQGSTPVVVLVVAYAIAFFSIYKLLLSRSRFVRTLTQILLFSAIYTDVLYLMLGAFPFSYPDAINLFNNPQYTSGALVTFKTAFLLAFAGAGACVCSGTTFFKKEANHLCTDMARGCSSAFRQCFFYT